jgi:lipoate-protein ligase A
MTAWSVHHAVGRAGDLHARPMPEVLERAVHVLEVDAPALVLGSTQRDDVVAPGVTIEVVRRHSGGGAVLLEPGGTRWVDLEIPRHDRLWDDDVGRAAWWVGEAWAAALGGGEVHRGALRQGRWGRLVCFAGLGPGEVTVAGRKVVGVSQRRTRAGARFQCAVPRRWEPERLAALLALDAKGRDALVAALAGAVSAVDVDVDALVEHLYELP